MALSIQKLTGGVVVQNMALGGLVLILGLLPLEQPIASAQFEAAAPLFQPPQPANLPAAVPGQTINSPYATAPYSEELLKKDAEVRRRFEQSLCRILEEEGDKALREAALVSILEWRMQSESIDRLALKGLRSDEFDEQLIALRLFQADCVTLSPQSQIELCIGLVERLERMLKDKPEVANHLNTVLGFAAKELATDPAKGVELLKERVAHSEALGPMLQLVKGIGPNAFEMREELVDLLSHTQDKQTMLLCLEILRKLNTPPRSNRNVMVSQWLTMFRNFDIDRNSQLSADELQRAGKISLGNIRIQDWKTLDTNGDQSVSNQEWVNYFAVANGANMMGVAPPAVPVPAVAPANNPFNR